MASSTPGMANAKSCIMEPIMPFESAVNQSSEEEESGWRTLLDHFLYCTSRVNFHGKQVVETVHFGGIL